MHFGVALPFAALAVIPLAIRSSSAALVVDSISFNYSQDFDSLNDAINPTNWQNDSTLPGWHLFRINVAPEPEPVPIQHYVMSDGNSSMGRFYSFGLSSAERSLGSIGNSPFGDGHSLISVPPDSIAGWIAVSFLNSSGVTLNEFAFNYTGEQWVNAGTSPQTMEFEYGFGATFASVTTWTKPTGAPISFDFTSPKFTADMGPVALDGNAMGNRTTGLGGTVAGITWLSGSTLWLRWNEKNDQFADHALAIDDFSFSVGVTAVPEARPLTVGVVLCFAALLTGLLRRFVSVSPEKNRAARLGSCQIDNVSSIVSGR